ncbi:MAG: polysaccharide biosynthesis/export family protein [Syntrophobacteraceae bacterium]
METKKKAQIVTLLAMIPLLLGLLQGCGRGGKGAGVIQVTAPEPAFPSNRPNQGDVFRIKEGDALGFVFLSNPELNTEQTVRHDGKISMKLIGNVVAAGLTPRELEEEVLGKYTDFVASSKYSKVFKEGDYFELRFVYNPELNIGVRVRSDGMISLPLVGDIQAAGVSPSDLRKDLIRRYSRDLNKPDIALLVGENTAKGIHTAENSLAVSVNKAAGHRVFVVGEVKTPRAVPVEGKLTLLQVLAEVGGATELGDMSRIVILRRSGERKIDWLQVDLESPLEGTDMRNDLLIHSGDIVVVPKTGIAKLNQWVAQYIRNMMPLPSQFSINANMLESGFVPGL